MDQTQFSHLRGATSSTEGLVTAKRMDQVEYRVYMKRTRDWDDKRADVEWKKMRNNPTIERGFKGVEKGCELRLDVPKGDYSLKRKSLFETKEVSFGTKQIKGMTEVEREQLIKECEFGHETFAATRYKANSSLDLEAFVVGLDDDALTSVLKAGSVAASSASEAGTEMSSESQWQAAVAGTALQSTPSTHKKQPVNVMSLRTRIHATLTRQSSKDLEVVKAGVIRAWEVLREIGETRTLGEEEFCKNINLTMGVCLEWLGMSTLPSPSEHSAVAPTLTPKPEYATQTSDTAEQAAASRQKNQGALHTLLGGMAVKPIENVNALRCFSQWRNHIDKIKTMEAVDDIKAAAEQANAVKVEVGLLAKALGKAVTDLRSYLAQVVKDGKRSRSRP